MASAPKCPPTLYGAEATSKIIKGWLIDEMKSRAGMVGVDDSLQVVSVLTSPHPFSQPELHSALVKSLRTSATGVVVYDVADGIRPAIDPVSASQLAAACEANNATLLDIIIYSPIIPKGWLSARQQGVI